MTTMRFKRRARKEAPRVPAGEVPLQAPPELPRNVPGGLLGKLMPVVMIVGMGGMMAMMFTTGGFSQNPMGMMFPVMMAFSMVGMFANQGGKGSNAAEINEDRKDYLRYLDGLRKDVEKTAEAQRKALDWMHPEPKNLWVLAGTTRMWERTHKDKDFCHVRVGTGGQRLSTRLVTPETGPVEELEPIAAVSLRRFVRAHSLVPALPTAVSVRGFAAVTIEGDRVASRDMVRCMLVQLVTFHGPDHCLLAVVCGPDTAPHWDWIKWLPHNQHPDAKDGVGSERMFYGSIREMHEGMGSLLDARNAYSRQAGAAADQVQICILVDGGIIDSGDVDRLRDNGITGVTVLDMSNYVKAPGARGLQLVVDGQLVGARAGAGIEPFATIDTMSAEEAEKVARRISPFRAPVVGSGEVEEMEDGERITSWAQMMNLGDIGQFNPDTQWPHRADRERLRVPFGLANDGSVVELDIKESAEGGMGPHGLCVGATGSGKSEFLRTLVLGLLATHSPDQLNMVLVDFKGGATFLGLDEAPHVAAVVTNLEGESILVDRMKDALAGEMSRRQELLASAGNFKNVADYEAARVAGADLDPLPALFIVIDEFSELLANHPDFADLFTMIGRLGRSLQVHILLASQRLEESKLKGLESHLSYRIGLKTFSAAESRSVIGVPDAYHLPGVPGAGYLKAGAESVLRFQAGYVSGPYSGGVTRREIIQAKKDDDRELDVNPRWFTANHAEFADSDWVSVPDEPEEVIEEKPEDDGPKISNLGMLVERIKGRGRLAHQIWLPPLDTPPALGELVGRSILTGEIAPVASLRTSIGLIDRPYEQRQDALQVDLSGALGNVAVVGGPQSGKSTAVRTLIMSMALTHSPEQVQFYVLDFGGGTMTGLAQLAHVGSVAGRQDVDRVRRTVSEVVTVLRHREIAFRDLGVESMAQFRQLRAADATSSQAAAGAHNDPFGDVFLVVDGWGSIKQEPQFEPLEQEIINLAVQGLSYGVHIIITAARWPEIKPAMKDQLGTRLELRLGDAMDSEFGRKVGELVPTGRPGRGILAGGLHTLTALPRVDGKTTAGDLSEGVVHAVAAINVAARPFRPAPAVRMLPERFGRDELLTGCQDWVAATTPPGKMLQIPIGINEAELAPVYLDFNANPHLIIFGDTECGKTNVLRNIVDGIVRSNVAKRGASIFVADYRNTMAGLVPPEHLAGYFSFAKELQSMMPGIVAALEARMPGPDVTPQQLRERSWWEGQEIYFIIDDYDMVVSGGNNPLLPLLDYLAQAKRVGLHVIVARMSGGAGRAMYETFLARLRELNTPGLMMSGNKDEGILLGNIKPSFLPPGRGHMITRTKTELIQTAWMPEV